MSSAYISSVVSNLYPHTHVNVTRAEYRILYFDIDLELATLCTPFAFLGGTLSRLQQGDLLTVTDNGRDLNPAPHKLAIDQPQGLPFRVILHSFDVFR